MKELLLLLFAVSMHMADAFIDGDSRQCNLITFVPFTFNGISTAAITRGQNKSIGFSHMVSAWMAMEQFNARDPSVVPELADELFKECNVTFRTNEAVFLDTASDGHQGSQLLYQNEASGTELPCAFVGPYHDSSALSIATMAASIGVPNIPSGGQDVRLAEELINPFTSVIYPRLQEIMPALGYFLHSHHRVNYTAVLFAFTDTGNQFQEGIGMLLDGLGMTGRRHFGYLSPTSPIPLVGQSIHNVLGNVKESGFRTIIIVMDNPQFDLPLIADAAEYHKLNNADFVWIFLPPFQLDAIESLIERPNSWKAVLDPLISPYDNVRKLLTGAAVIHAVEGFQKDFEKDRFAKAWKSIDESFVERLNTQAIAITPGRRWTVSDYEPATVEHFRMHEPVLGSSFIFDAIMSVGMGACIAENKHRVVGMSNQSILGEEQREGIRVVNFTGASGRVEFGPTTSLLGVGNNSRIPASMSIGIFNLYPPSSEELDGSEEDGQSYVLTAILSNLMSREILYNITRGDEFAEHMNVDEYHPFVFRDGRTTAPELLRDSPDQNYLSPSLRYLGLAMMGFALLCCLLCFVWVIVHRNSRIVIASQPQFLYILIFGAAMSSLSIFGITTDEGWSGFTSQQLSRHCMSIVWLACLGHIFTYGALFTKLWRINKVLQFTRRVVASSTVAWPAALLMLLALSLLTLWQCLDPLKWIRVEVDPVHGDSIGGCYCESMTYFIIALGIVMLIPSVLTCVMAWKTKDVDDTYSESSWIFNLILVQLQVIIVALPLVIVLRDVSTDGKFIGHLLLLWTMPMSTLSFIMVPKIVAQYRASRGIIQSGQVRGSGGGAVKVSGFPATAEHRSST